MILLLGSEDDPHLVLVSSALGDLGVEHRFIDHKALTPVSLTIPGEVMRVGLESVRQDDIALVWSRAKVIYQRYGEGDAYTNQFFWGRGWRTYFDEFSALLGERVVNSVASVRASSDKLHQLTVARGLGFEIPETLVSNDPTEIHDWGRRFSSVVIKALGDPAIPNVRKPFGQTVIMTTPVDWDLFAASLEGARVFPALYQAEVPKRLELRVAVQGEAIFAFAVDSQARDYTKVDWRYGTQLAIFEPFALPVEVAQFCRRYLAAFGLFAGHFDFILTPDDRYVFLECNPQGQWAWLDDLTKGEMSRQFAEGLANRAKSGALPRVSAE
jgi:hypothetical protein